MPISKSYIGLKIEAGKKPANQGIQNSTKMFYPKFMNRVYEWDLKRVAKRSAIGADEKILTRI